ncbi:serine/threonine-protein kinase [Streptomyces tanashiensis]|uniref:non-specific serine/threonine protein kinase n=3 Tax=Streptomyces tanashiensis TaxID=67367 RepID=A0ABY6R6I9_9ACTN|nr:serine/threonine-protein kinase [Streptomyces tanashiensis]UZX25356.1 serine/threonine protein kinase [Streptomyces tanashiensis]
MSRVIDGRFELVERLGGGGMGTVWRARDLALHRDVAVKEVRPPDPAMAEHDVEGARTLRARVLREARALARIDHPNVVTIHHIVDAGEGTYPWLVMELVTGGSLQDRLERGTMTPPEAAALGRELLSALRAAHERDIEHRDVKPANVLLRPDGRPVLTDFGIAAIRESTVLTASGSIIGSPDYMAPERIRGGTSGPAADLWSLAMLLYVAVEGRHPLRRENTLATLAAVLSDDVPAPLRAGALTGVLTRLLVRDPAARPDADALDRALAAVAAEAPEVSGDEVSGEGVSGEGVSGEGGTTSFRLAPPDVSAPAPTAAPAAGPVSALDPPSGGTPATAPVGAAPAPAAGRRRRGRVARFLGSAAVVVLAVGIPVAAMSWEWRPADPASGPSTAPPAGRPPASSAPAKETAPEKLDLLTADGVRTAVAAVKAASGGAKVTGFVVYPDYAVAESLVKGSTKRYDRYVYRGGDVAVREGPGGTAFPGSVPVDLDTFSWGALPALMKRADKELGVEKPTSRYVVLTPGSTLTGFEAGLSVYLSDTYGVAYLKADAKGRVTATYPRKD